MTRNRSSIVLSAAVVLFTAAPSAAAILDTQCSRDAESGLLVPGTTPGLCLTEREGTATLVLSTDRGLLVLDPQGEPPLPERGRDGSSAYVLVDRDARALLCPAGAGRPDASCLAGALSGTVRVDAALHVGPEGTVRAPSTLLAWGSVSDAGEERSLRASLVLVADRRGATRALDALELSGTPEGPSRTENEDLEGLRRMGRLSREEWEVVQHLVAMDEDSWQRLQSLLELGSREAPPPGSSPSGAVELVPRDDLGSEEIVLPLGVIDMLRDLLTRVNGVRSAVSNVQGVVNDVQGVLGSARPDIRGLVAGIDLDRLRDLMDEVRDVLQGAVEIARELRVGFESFDVVAFRVDLKGLLGDLGGAWTDVQKLGCFERPDLTLREWNFPLALKIIDVAPPVVLYAMSRLLDQIAPDWRTSVSSLRADIPPSLLEGICTTETATAAAPGQRLESGTAVCNALEPSGIEPSLKAVKILAKIVSTRFEIMSEWAKDDDVVGLGAVVVGGATVVKKVEFPSKPAFKQISIMLDRLSSMAESLLDARKDCLDDAREDQALDDEIEEMVRDCRPSHTVFLDSTDSTLPPTLLQVIVTVQQFIDRMRLAGFGAEAGHAQTIWDGHLTQATARERFDTMCQAYAALIPPPAGGGGVGTRPTRR